MTRLHARTGLALWSNPYAGRYRSVPPLLRRSSSSTAGTPFQPDPRWPAWKPTVGLELHVQLKGNPKLFSPETAVYDDPPNTHVAPFDAALPGALPILQPAAVRLALLACLAFKADINPHSTFDRKHYFYPDLTTGFQITQKYAPLAMNGLVRVKTPRQKKPKSSHQHKLESDFFQVRLEQIQLEQDTAKSFHDPSLPHGGGTLVDLNRAGAALVEIVTKPDMRSPEEAAAFVKTLQAILRHVGASGANMEKGELRCDVNVSVAKINAHGQVEQEGTRCEVKNLNGVRFIAGAVESEIRRQIADLERGIPIEQATRGFDAVSHSTFHLRSKESSPDYRYMPDPELGPVRLCAQALRELERELPELPAEAEERLAKEYGLGKRECEVLVALGEGAEETTAAVEAEADVEMEPGIGVRWFEQVAQGRDPKKAANWLIHTLLGLLSRSGYTLSTSPISANELGALIDAVTSRRMTGTEAKTLLADFSSSASSRLSTANGSYQTFETTLSKLLESRPAAESASSRDPAAPASAVTASDDSLAALVADVIASHPDEVAKIRKGQLKVVKRLVGESMKRSRGRADAKKVEELLLERLTGAES
ncbi:hypothetical protein JCM3774_002829 [Rhodotorula dairenensis]